MGYTFRVSPTSRNSIESPLVELDCKYVNGKDVPPKILVLEQLYASPSGAERAYTYMRMDD